MAVTKWRRSSLMVLWRPRTSIQDVGRVLDMPLSEVTLMKKLVPETLGITLRGAIDQVPELKAIFEGKDLRGTVLREAEKLEGSVRNTGVHAAGLIIAPYDLTDIVPGVGTAKDSELLVTQYDGRVIEDAGRYQDGLFGAENTDHY